MNRSFLQKINALDKKLRKNVTVHSQENPI